MLSLLVMPTVRPSAATEVTAFHNSC